MRARQALLILCTALTLGGVGICVGTLIGWQTAKALPSDAQAIAIASDIFPGKPLFRAGRFEPIFGSEQPWTTETWVFGTRDYVAGYERLYTPPKSFDMLDISTWNATDAIDVVKITMINEGWSVRQVGTDHLVAHKDDALIEVDPWLGAHNEKGIAFKVERTAPKLVLQLGYVGLALGLAAGAGLGIAARHRSLITRVLLGAAIVLLSVDTGYSFYRMVTMALDHTGTVPTAPWAVYLWPVVGWLFTGIAVLLLAVVFLLVGIDHRGNPRSGRDHSGRPRMARLEKVSAVSEPD